MKDVTENFTNDMSKFWIDEYKSLAFTEKSRYNQ